MRTVARRIADHKYNISDKGRARNRRYYRRRWDSDPEFRIAERTRIRKYHARQSAIRDGDWHFVRYLDGEISWGQLLEADYLPPFAPIIY
jgi:hypothetical protein